jgi:hypothetical protein
VNKNKPGTATPFIVALLAGAAGIFIALGPVQDHASSIEFALLFYVLCIWIWRVMVAVGVALLAGWGLSHIVSVNAGYLSLALLVLGLAPGIVWHVRHRRRIAEVDDA